MATTTILLLCANAAFGLSVQQLGDDSDCKAACGGCKTEETCLQVAAESNDCAWGLENSAADEFTDPEDAFCRKKICADVNGMEGMGDMSLQCTDWISPGTCEWHSDEFVCWEKGKPLPCNQGGGWEEDTCTAYAKSSGLSCVWNSDEYSCNDANVKESCGGNSIYDEDSCKKVDDCVWAASSHQQDGYDECGLCYDGSKFAGGQPPCDAFFEKGKTCCPTDRCKWTVIMTPMEDDDAGDFTEDEDGRCTAQDEIVACKEYEAQQECVGSQPSGSCEWIEEGTGGEMGYGLCTPAGRQVECNKLNQEACAPLDECWWTTSLTTMEPGMEDEGACEKCDLSQHNNNCVQPYVGPHGPDDDKACATHSEENCPVDEGRCELHYDDDMGGGSYNDWECQSGGGMGGGATCSDPQCSDKWDKTECTSLNSVCTWNADDYECTNSTAAPVCDRHYDTASCSGASGCKWLSPSSPAGCDQDGPGDDGGYCVPSADTNVPCKALDAFESSCCPSYCHWDGDYCHESSYEAPCESFGGNVNGKAGDPLTCPTDRCKVSHGVCIAQGTSIDCSNICEQFLCTRAGSGCHWDTENGGCQSGENAPIVCASYSEEYDCMDEQQCQWLGNGKCSDKVCSEFEKTNCGAMYPTCTWHDEAGCYYADETLPCDKYQAQSACPTSCSWNSDAYMCLDQNEDAPCHAFYAEADCKTAKCEWRSNEWGGLSCEAPTSQTGVPSLNGGGSRAIEDCNAALESKVGVALDTVTDECSDQWSEPAPATDDQLKCLAYYLSAASSTISESCPCIWKWATHSEAGRDSWMQVNC